MRKMSYFVCGFLLFTLILSGCGKLKRKGPEPQNMIPQVFFSDIPPEGDSVSISPRIYWYGTDQDGFIVAYQYAVIVDSVIKVWGGGTLDLEGAIDSLKGIGPDSASWVDNATRLNIFGVHVTAEGGNSGNVRLYAEMDPSIFTPQHIFLRAVDNASGTSEIKTRMYWRNNHAPQCSLDVDSTFVENNFYCLPETTQTWKGIEINWVGLDTLDYPDMRKQPDFYYRWELWGPYADTLKLNDPIAKKVASSLDSIKIGETWLRDEWTLNKSNIFRNLDNYPDSGYGWYQLRVWSRDDAFVSSIKPAKTFFRILKPLFRYKDSQRKTILVLDATTYGGKADGRPNLTMTRAFYDTTLSQLQVSQPGICDNFNILPLGESPSEDSLSRYDLVIVLNLGKDVGISEKNWIKLENYLNVGGRIWVIGMNNYGVMNMKRGEVSLAGFEVATDYFGLEGIVDPNYAPGDPDWLEFVAADPFGSWGLPYLEMDPAKAEKLEGYTPTDPGKNFSQNGIPRVPTEEISATLDFAKRSAFQRRLYSFVSRRGRDSIMEEMPCATTYIGSTYRTAEFVFPLSLMKNDGARETFRKMINWFWEDLPQP
jgi:hypothetical protein